MKSLLLRLFLLAPLGVLLVGVNYFVDPANLFSGGTYERGVAALLAKGQHVTNLRNFDERLLQKFSIATLPKRPPVLVIGSSRSMLIGENIYPQGTVHNGGVSGGVAEDLLAVYQMYTARGWHADTLVIGLDPWMLNDNHGQERWKTLATEALQMRRQLGAEAAGGEAEDGLGNLVASGSTLAKLGELLSLSYFQSAIKQLRDPSKRPSAYRATNQAVNDEFTKHPDNTISYARTYREQNSDDAARSYMANKPVYSLGTYTGLSADVRNVLEKMVTDARSKGSVVVLFMAPYHPTVWKFLVSNPDYQYVTKSEAWFRELAAREHLRLIGSFDPTPFNLTSADFYDGMHCKPEVVERLFGVPTGRVMVAADSATSAAH